MNENELLSTQESVLEQYFRLNTSFLWDKAKELVEKERDCQRHQQSLSSVMSSMMTALAQLSLADKNYINLLFLAPKGFLRKDVVKGMYETLRNEFERLEDRGNHISTDSSRPSTPAIAVKVMTNTSPKSTKSTTSGTTTPTPSTSSSIRSFAASISSALISPSSTTSMSNSQSVTNSPMRATLEVLDRLAAHICGQLLHYVRARIEMMEIYLKITLISNQKFCLFDDCINGLQEVMKTNVKHFHHPILSSVKTGFNFECDILMSLLKAETNVQNLRFLESLYDLNESQTKLSSWALMFLNKETAQRRNSILRSTIVPPLYLWLCRLKSSLISKYSLYFYTTLSKQVSNECANDLKTVCGKHSIDYIQKITTFQRKSDAQFVSLVFESHGCDDYKGLGYHSPYKWFESPKGIDSFPILYSYPSDVPKNHLPTLIMIINNKFKELNATDSVVALFDHHLNSTYFLIRPDPRITLSVIFESKKSEKDSYVCSFLQDMCGQLRGNKVLISLKPGIK